MFIAVGVLTALGLGLGFVLGVAARKFHVEKDPLEQEIEALLPGSNCGQCGFPGCPAAATAMASGEAAVTICPPGGRTAAEAIAEKLGVTADLSELDDGPAKVARVDESNCIGCIKCFRECPTDAVVGAPKQIHVVMWAACTGCGKCVEACPTLCIEMVEPPATLQQWQWEKPQAALGRAA